MRRNPCQPPRGRTTTARERQEVERSRPDFRPATSTARLCNRSRAANTSRPALKPSQEVPRPPHEDGPRATQQRQPTARSVQQLTRHWLPTSSIREHTAGRTRTDFQHCDAARCASTHAGREKKPPKARARSGAVRPHKPTTPPPTALASRRSTQMPTAARPAVPWPTPPAQKAKRDVKKRRKRTKRARAIKSG